MLCGHFLVELFSKGHHSINKGVIISNFLNINLNIKSPSNDTKNSRKMGITHLLFLEKKTLIWTIIVCKE